MHRGLKLLFVGAWVAVVGDANGATKLNGPLTQGGDVVQFELTPDGNYVLYEADQEIDNFAQLYRVDVSGSFAPVKLSGQIEVFSAFQVSNDSARAVFRTRLTPDGNTVGLSSVAVDGSQFPIDLDGTVFNQFGSRYFEITADSKRVVFSADSGSVLYSTLIDGSAQRVQLDPPRIDIDPEQISPDGQWLIYRHQDQGSNGGVFAQPIDGSAPAVRLDDGTGNVINSVFPVTPDGNRIVFTVSTGDSRRAVHYSAPLHGGGATIALNEALLQNGNNPNISPPDYMLSPDGKYLVFQFDEGADSKRELFVRPVDGNEPGKRLTGMPMAGGGVSYGGFEISPNSNRIIYIAPQDQAGVYELYGRSLVGDDPPVKLNASLADGFDVSGPKITPDGSHVIYSVVGPGPSYLTSLHAAPIDGTASSIELSGDPEEAAKFASWKISPDGSFVVYGVDMDGYSFEPNFYDLPEIHVLYAVSVAGGIPHRITDTLGDGRKIFSYEITPDSRGVIYLANEENPNTYELFSVPLFIPEPSSAILVIAAMYFLSMWRFPNR